MNPPESDPYDSEVVRLRLQLSHAEMQRDAYAAALKAEVRALLCDTIRGQLLERDRLKAEVERLTTFTTRTIIPNEKLEADLENCRIALRVKYDEVARFKAEVDRLNAAIISGGAIVPDAEPQKDA
jgi:hypothetical protein